MYQIQFKNFMAEDELILVLSGILKPFFIMKPVKDFENYLISKEGVVYSLLYKKVLVTTFDKAGYERITLSKNRFRKTMFIHRLVGINYIPNPENKPFINHKNGIKNDNRLENLEWYTHIENAKHAWDNGFYKITKEGLEKAHEACSKKIYDSITKTTYKSISEAARNFNMPFTTFKRLTERTERFIYL